MNIIGRKPVLEALKSERNIVRLKIADGVQGKIIGEIIAEAKRRNIRIDRITRNRIKSVFGTANHQGVMIEISEIRLYSESDIGSDLVPLKYNLFVALDGVTDPYHLGAIARAALGAGSDGLLLPARRSSPLTEVAVKASAGALLKIPVIKVGNLTNSLEALKLDDWWIYGAAGGGSSNLWKTELKDKIVLVMGSEGKGLSRKVSQCCDELISIPLRAGLESLSVSSAASVFLFEIARQRKLS